MILDLNNKINLQQQRRGSRSWVAAVGWPPLTGCTYVVAFAFTEQGRGKQARAAAPCMSVHGFTPHWYSSIVLPLLPFSMNPREKTVRSAVAHGVREHASSNRGARRQEIVTVLDGWASYRVMSEEGFPTTLMVLAPN
jgi:hypothetical protein